jgi:hypothetical protein
VSCSCNSLSAVIAGLVPAIPIKGAWLCLPNRDGRDKPGHDEPRVFWLAARNLLFGSEVAVECFGIDFDQCDGFAFCDDLRKRRE